MGSCLHPLLINKPSKRPELGKMVSGYNFVSHPGYEMFVKSPRVSKLYGFYRDKMIVSCGKCVECLKKRQSSLSVRCMREAAKRGSMCFLTLTYDNFYLPLQISLESVNKDSGECTLMCQSPLVRPVDPEKDGAPEFVEWCRAELDKIPKSPSARVITKDFFEDEEFLYRYVITPSLNRRDVRLWLKRSRVRYRREMGKPLPEFTYVVCGEMGPKTCRPHYHLAFFGLDWTQVSYLQNQWEYGFTNLKKVNAVNEDGTNGFEIASRYIGKYMSKGKFECDSVKDCLAEKPRLMMSKGLGTDLSDNLISYYRCYDLFGRYDIDTLRLDSTGVKLTTVQLFSIFEEIRKRSFMTFSGKKYCIPHNILLKIWYIYEDFDKAYRSCQLRRLYTDYFNRDSVAVYIDQLLKDNPNIDPSEVRNLVREFVASSENSDLLQEKFSERALRAFYQKSIF